MEAGGCLASKGNEGAFHLSRVTLADATGVPLKGFLFQDPTGECKVCVCVCVCVSVSVMSSSLQPNGL